MNHQADSWTLVSTKVARRGIMQYALNTNDLQTTLGTCVYKGDALDITGVDGESGAGPESRCEGVSLRQTLITPDLGAKRRTGVFAQIAW
jgi:hypothetical protein